MTRGRGALWATIAVAALAPAAGGAAPATIGPHLERFTIRGHPQALHVYGERGGPPALVSSGDGGWVHLAPDIAEFLASEGYFVVGFDAKAYLSGFTTSTGTLTVDDVPRDYAALVDYTARGAPGRPLLVGVSEGAGLSLLAATAPEIQARVGGVIALGLPERNELGWRWRDSVIYVTKKVPNEPTFSAREVAARVAPVPLAAIHSTHDEFVPVPEVRDILASAREPKRLWVVESKNHRFSDNQAELNRSLEEAISWTQSARKAAR
jgi:type IV secretory pathway VirJ component